MQRLATQQRLGLQRFLFEKALKLSGGARQMTGTGAIISHLQVDCRLVSQGERSLPTF
jgi:ABC-type phosphate/phosphonate transport system ATPase subunit